MINLSQIKSKKNIQKEIETIQLQNLDMDHHQVRIGTSQSNKQ